MECSLGTGDLLRLTGGSQGTRLHCLRGTVWLTRGDGVDYLVHQGQSIALACADSALVEALGAAEVRLEPAFREIYRDIWAKLKEEVSKTYAQEEESAA